VSVCSGRTDSEINHIFQGGGLRRFVLVSSCTLVLLAALAPAQDVQRIDAFVGGGELFASHFLSASQAYQPPAESGGIYPSFGAEGILANRFGISAEGAIRFYRGSYNGYQPYRSMFFDINGVFAPQINKRISLDLMVGPGFQTVLFYNQVGTCSSSTFCRTNLNSTHFLIHVGGGPRYYFHKQFFVRPEVNYYFVVNNSQFHSDNVVRLGASVGYSWGSR
jgi:hypothetical protein